MCGFVKMRSGGRHVAGVDARKSSRSDRKLQRNSCNQRWIGREVLHVQMMARETHFRWCPEANRDISRIQYRNLTRSTIWIGVTQNLRAQPLEAEERWYMESKDWTRHWESDWEWIWSVGRSHATNTNEPRFGTYRHAIVNSRYLRGGGNTLPRIRKSPTEN